MQRISITNPQNIIDGTAKKYYFKLRNTGGPKGDKGDKGDTGATGPQGPQGNAATVSVGSTTTLPVGHDATVTNSGSIYNAVLDFGIPQGPQGPQGAKGDKGDTGAKGDTGPRGPQGERGTNATVYVGTTTTTNPGTQARVYNSGTDSNAVLNFEIPRGDVGPQPELVQTTGTSTTKAMSQKATTDALNTKQATITNSNKLSADLVTDTTTTNKFVTAEDKTTWNAKQNALTAGQGIDITSDVISTSALVPEVVTELPTTGEKNKLYLTPKNYTTQTATGNPITATVAEEVGKIESFQLDGDTLQNGTPTPEESVPIQTVTGTQTITINGTEYPLNLSETVELDMSQATRLDAYISGSGGTIVSSDTSALFSIAVEPNTTYTITKIESSRFRFVCTSTTPAIGTAVGKTTNDDNATTASVTTGANDTYLVCVYWSRNSTNTKDEVFNSVRITARAHIELCELGDDGNGNPLYKDYIYPDGDDWKVHKATSRVTLTGQENWSDNWQRTDHTNYIQFYLRKADFTDNYAVSTIDNTKCNHFAVNPTSPDTVWKTDDEAYAINSNATYTLQFKIARATVASLADWITWLASNPTTVYYALATPTDTAITDQTLIAQLEAIRTALLQNGANTITNTATGSDLAGDMEIGYYDFAPRNRYDKWLWLDIDNEYEQLGS